MSKTRRNDPYLNFRFDVELTGSNMIIGSFSEVSGLEASTETEEYIEGGNNDFSYKFVSITKYPNLVLKRGMTDSDVLYKWYKNVVMGKIVTNNISILLLDEKKNEVKRWAFQKAYPVKWSAGELSATGNIVETEILEFVHQGLSW